MVYNIQYTNSDKDKIISRFNERVLQEFKVKVEKKNNELEWVDNLNKLTNRFYNFFGFSGHHIAELKVRAESNCFRAILIVDRENQNLLFYEFIKKGTGRQDDVLQSLRKHPRKAKQRTQRKLREESPVTMSSKP